MSMKIMGERLKPKADLFALDLELLKVKSFMAACTWVLRKMG